VAGPRPVPDQPAVPHVEADHQHGRSGHPHPRTSTTDAARINSAASMLR
jgi:hypothetical protein